MIAARHGNDLASEDCCFFTGEEAGYVGDLSCFAEPLQKRGRGQSLGVFGFDALCHGCAYDTWRNAIDVDVGRELAGQTARPGCDGRFSRRIIALPRFAGKDDG